MADALTLRCHDEYRLTAAAAVASGEVWQLATGEAAVYTGLNAAAINDRSNFTTEGQFTMPKTADAFVFLKGGRAYWDHSANVVHYKKVNDRDFYLGRFVEDATAAATTCVVNLNIDPPYDVDLLSNHGGQGGNLSVPTGTQATGSAGFGLPRVYGGSQAIRVTATSEAQCIDMLSVDRFAVGSNWIAEFIVRLAANGSGSACDLTWGVANGTSTTDADAITESCFFHIDGGALTILAESDDGTVEVGATTTTISITEGTAVANRFEFWLDGRDTTNVKYYINGAEVNAATSNLGDIRLAAGPLGLLVHIEKTTGTETIGPLYIDAARCRLMEQD